MNFLNRIKFPALAGILLVVALVSCEQELTTIGAGVVGDEPFITGKQEFDVFAFNKKIKAVQTNQLPLYQLGVFEDTVYGRTEAFITAQVTLPGANPTFGDFSQAEESIPENESIDSVLVYLPYQLNNIDTDRDGVPDNLEIGPDILDPANDSDGDGIANNVEVSNGTNPQSDDTDGDGQLDGDDDSNDAPTFPLKRDLDSIYGGNISESFMFKVERSNFFLRDLDPNTSFQEAQEYYSDQSFSEFTEEVFYEGSSTLQDIQYLVPGEEDNPSTDVDESIQVRVEPGIRVRLNETAEQYFQDNLLDKEGSAELLSAANFKNFFRGVRFSVIPSDNELLFLLNIAGARIEVYYSYDDVVDEVTVREQSSVNLAFLSGSNAVNTFVSEDYPENISTAMDNGENASRIYLKGGAGSFAEIKLFDQVNGREAINEIKNNNWIINEANLTFFIDRATVNGAVEPPRLYLYNAETNAPLFSPTLDLLDQNSSLRSYPLYNGLLESETDGTGIKYTIGLTNYINDLVIRDAENATLGLMITPDIRSVGARNAMLEEIDENGNAIEQELPVISTISPLGTVLFGSQEIPGQEEFKLKLEISYTQVN